MAGDKIRLRFRKAGGLRLLSHHDLMRCAERMCRRAAVPLKFTAGFHPAPRIVFALSLSLGAEGANEVVEVELTRPLTADELLASLNAQAPAGLTFFSAKVIDPKATAVPRRMVYRLPLPADRVGPTAALARELLAQDKVWVDRLRHRPRRVNVRPYLRRIEVRDGAVELDLWVTPFGTARADELVKLLGLQDELDAGAVLERTELELHDETLPGQPDGPPEGPAETAPLNHAPVGAIEEDAVAGTWGLSPNGPVVE